MDGFGGGSALLQRQRSRGFLCLCLLLVLSSARCSRSGQDGGAPDGSYSANIPQATVITPECQDSSALAPGDTKVCRLSNGSDILIQNLGGRVLFQVEGVIANDDFANIQKALSVADKPASEQKIILDNEVQKVLKLMETKVHAIPISHDGRVGYFSALVPIEREVMGSLKTFKFPRDITIVPVVYNQNAIKILESNRPSDEGLVARGDARGDLSSLSGLKQIRAQEFKDLAERSIGGGEVVDGSSVRLGISDTGITFNHPTFLSGKTGQTRIVYMKDFTGEGTVFFNPAAALTLTEAKTQDPEDLDVSGQVLVTPKLPSRPAGDDFAEVKGLHIKVNEEQKKILLDPTAKVKLGVMLEQAFQAPGDPVDLNANGKVDDKLFVLYVTPKSGADFIYFDSSGTGDFRKSPMIHDWNSSHEMIKVFSEKIGFAFGAADLPDASGTQKVSVKSVSIVGYDPGNHGSHVAGIAAGLRTIQNSGTLTLARGVAPEAQILMNRVCSNNAGCSATNAIIDLALNANAEVINMSLGGLDNFNDGVGVEETVINRLTVMKNVLFVISAGNSGPGRQTIGSPSTARLSLSVGASAARSLIEAQYQWPGFGSTKDGDNFMLFFSSRGPTASGGFKPNVSAPGTELSSVQLNAAPGARSGLDVYWGTSMAAPTATGAYALFLDAVKKYNATHPTTKLPTDVRLLRQVLISSATPFDVNRFDPETGEKLTGQYTWADEGFGILNLEAAWNKMMEFQKSKFVSNVSMADGTPVYLDYKVVVSATSPNGNTYDGSRKGADGEPIFGDGVYLSSSEAEIEREVHIARRLPETLLKSPEAGDLAAKLATTQDDFELKLLFYGSDKPWMKIGTMSELGCSETARKDFKIIGEGVQIVNGGKSKGSLGVSKPSVLNLCLDRASMNRDLTPGDHGALILAYLKSPDGSLLPVPSFTVPVFVTIPHKVMEGSTGYNVTSTVKSFGVSRNYVKVPEGTTLLQVTLEVPPLKVDSRGVAAPGEECSGVELMALEGLNTSVSVERPAARVSNCTDTGAPQKDPKKRVLSFSRTNPRAGIWDLHVFGQYKYKMSQYSLKVDYVTVAMNRKAILGTVKDLSGQLEVAVKEASLALQIDPQVSSYELTGIGYQVASQVAAKSVAFPAGPFGLMRSYPSQATSVVVRTGGAPGSDIDIVVVSCPQGAQNPNASGCEAVGGSGGATDEELVKFEPDPSRVYVFGVAGYDIKGSGSFWFREIVNLPVETGDLQITNSAPTFNVSYEFSAAQIAKSLILNHPLFKSNQVFALGSLNLRIADKTLIGSIPVRVSQ